MNEEIQGNPEVVPTEAPQVDPIEKKAMEMGWRPLEQFDGNEDDFIDAKEFVRRRPLYDKIEYQSKELKAVKKALEEFKGHYSKVNEAAYTRALDTLKQAREDAVETGDREQFKILDNKIQEAEKEVAEIQEFAKTPTQDAGTPPEFASWKQRNSWYQKDEELTNFADDLGTGLARRGVSPEEVLKRVTEAVKKQFPDKFVNKNKQSAPSVETSGGRSKAAESRDESNLTAQERKIMLDFERQKIMTRKEYMDSLRTVKGAA